MYCLILSFYFFTFNYMNKQQQKKLMKNKFHSLNIKHIYIRKKFYSIGLFFIHLIKVFIF